MKAVILQLFMLCVVAVNSEVLDHRFFLEQIIEKYGHNGTISYEGFERLYRNLGLGRSENKGPEVMVNTRDEQQSVATLTRTGRDVNSLGKTKDCKSQEELAHLVHEHKETEGPVHVNPPRACLSPREVLAVYGFIDTVGILSPVSFLHLCPAIIYELDQQSCADTSHEDHSHESAESSTYSSWLFAILTILVISVAGLLCVAVVPLLHKSFVHQIISFLVALAVGTLLGDAFLHLIPHALGSHGSQHGDEHTDSLMKTGLMFLTVVFFFTFEAVLNTYKKNKKRKRPVNVNYISVNVNENEKEMMEMAGEHQHSHGNGHNNTALMVIMGDGLHNLVDGLAIGAAFSGGLAPGFATAVAVFTHELPHELGDFAVLLQSGVTVRQALLYNFLSSVLSFVGTLVGLLIGNFGDATRWIYAVTAGSFIYIALSNLAPEINRQSSDGRTILLRLSGILCGGALMGTIALYEHDIKHLFL